jgi:hypothetical protein
MRDRLCISEEEARSEAAVRRVGRRAFCHGVPAGFGEAQRSSIPGAALAQDAPPLFIQTSEF